MEPHPYPPVAVIAKVPIIYKHCIVHYLTPTFPLYCNTFKAIGHIEGKNHIQANFDQLISMNIYFVFSIRVTNSWIAVNYSVTNAIYNLVCDGTAYY